MLLGIGLFGVITAYITSYVMSHDLTHLETKLDTDVMLDRTIPENDAFRRKDLLCRRDPRLQLERLAESEEAGDLTGKEFKRAKAGLLANVARSRRHLTWQPTPTFAMGRGICEHHIDPTWPRLPVPSLLD